MRKIPTLFVRDENDRRHVTEHITPGCEWVTAGEGIATRKYDGTCVMLDEQDHWWARREVKPGKEAPPNFAAVEHDDATGKTVGWEPIEQSAFAKWHAEAISHEAFTGRGSVPGGWKPGTYELLGPRINGNPEKIEPLHWLLRHGGAVQLHDAPRDFTGLATWVPKSGFEGIVWHGGPDGAMAKIKARDFKEEWRA
jgi:hypothetical protein